MKLSDMTNPLETIKTPLEAYRRCLPGVGKDAVYFALRKAFNLGKEHEMTAFPEEYEREFREFQQEFSSRFD